LKALRTCAVYNRLLALYLKPAVPKLNPKSNALDGLALDLLWTCSGLALDLLWTCSGLALSLNQLTTTLGLQLRPPVE